MLPEEPYARVDGLTFSVLPVEVTTVTIMVCENPIRPKLSMALTVISINPVIVGFHMMEYGDELSVSKSVDP